MTTQLEIYNQALAMLTQPPLSNTVGTTAAHDLLNASWAEAVKISLESGDWDFAMKMVILARDSTTPAFSFSYFYRIPSDSARICWLSETGREGDTVPPGRYRIVGPLIASSADALYCRHVSYDFMSTPGRWSSTFGRAVAGQLATMVPKLNTGGLELAAKEREGFGKRAQGLDAVQGPVQPRRSRGSWVNANRRRTRGGSGLPEQQV